MSAASFLDRMAAASRARARRARQRVPEQKLLASASETPPPPRLKLGTFDLIAEVKLRSPAVGSLDTGAFDLKAQVEAYARGGACAVSVLTEPDAFHGSLEHLSGAASFLTPLDCPVMRKDFVTDPYQILEARAAGASGVLLIVTMLDDGTVAELLQCAHEHGLFVLLEGFDRADLERIARCTRAASDPPVLAGLNCRDLKSLEIDFGRFSQLADALPADLPVVAESGVQTADQVSIVAKLGYAAVLVGSALMRAEDPARVLAELIAAGREAAEAR